MDILSNAYKGLFPDKEPNHTFHLKYSGRFKGYNANVRYTAQSMTFNLSRNWEKIDDDIKMGLIQALMSKVYRYKQHTFNIDLYNNFLKNIHIAIPVTMSEPELKESFDRVNHMHFDDLIEPVNLKWGNGSIRTFGTYEYGTDTITINPALKDRPELIDYVMHHEMLHKKHKFKHTVSKSMHHTKEFKQDEESYPNHKILERELSKISLINRVKKKAPKLFHWF